MRGERPRRATRGAAVLFLVAAEAGNFRYSHCSCSVADMDKGKFSYTPLFFG